jgi:two-component system cell cycle sensor histidine kinase/response regulator CckA
MTPLNDEQYRAVLDHGPTMIWRAGLDAKCDYFNATWLAYTGRSLEQEVGNGWTEGVHPDDLGECVATYLAHFERREPFEMEYRLRRFDGVYRYIVDRGVPFTGTTGNFGGFIGSCMDVDERHEVFAGAHDFFQMSLDNLCVAGFDGYFKRLNPSWTRTLGWTIEELMSRPSEEFVHPDDRGATLAGRHRLRGGATMGPLINRYRCKDGTYRWFEWRSVAHVDRGLVYAAARDITEQKRAEERLREAKELHEKLQRQLIFTDRMASMGTLAAGIAHEINNPLAYVIGNINLILEELRDLDAGSITQRLAALHEMALDALGGAERIRKIVGGLKTFSRAEEERRSAIDLQPLLELSIDMAFNEIRHRGHLVREFGATPLVDADDARLGQVFVNLLVNAAQALPEGDSDANEIRIVTSTDAQGRAVIEVRDTGSGIPAHVIGRIFDPFFTTKPIDVGTGLGLFVSHNIVTSMGGEITVVSEEGRGTTFRVAIPAATSAVQHEAPAAPEPPPAAVACGSVLVVDDEPSIGAVLRRVLREHEVTVVNDARLALDLLGAGRRFDVILSDLMMPVVSGMEFYDEVKRRFPEEADRVVFVSGGAFTPVANAFLDRVTNERLQKPFDPKVVRDLVQRFVR